MIFLAILLVFVAGYFTMNLVRNSSRHNIRLHVALGALGLIAGCLYLALLCYRVGGGLR